jgi:hypothetical protein
MFEYLVEPRHQAHRLFLDQEVRRRHVEMQRHAPRHRPHRVVRRDPHLRRLGDGRDLAAAGQPAAMAEIGLDVGNGLKLGQLREFAQGEQTLSGGERAVYPAGQSGHRRGIAGLDRFFHEQRGGWARSRR